MSVYPQKKEEVILPIQNPPDKTVEELNLLIKKYIPKFETEAKQKSTEILKQLSSFNFSDPEFRKKIDDYYSLTVDDIKKIYIEIGIDPEEAYYFALIKIGIRDTISDPNEVIEILKKLQQNIKEKTAIPKSSEISPFGVFDKDDKGDKGKFTYGGWMPGDSGPRPSLFDEMFRGDPYYSQKKHEPKEVAALDAFISVTAIVWGPPVLAMLIVAFILVSPFIMQGGKKSKKRRTRKSRKNRKSKRRSNRKK